MYYFYCKNINNCIYKKYIKKKISEPVNKVRNTSEKYDLTLLERFQELNSTLMENNFPDEEKKCFLFRVYIHEQNQYQILYPEKYNEDWSIYNFLSIEDQFDDTKLRYIIKFDEYLKKKNEIKVPFYFYEYLLRNIVKKEDIFEINKLSRFFLKNNLKDVHNFEEFMREFVFKNHFFNINFLYFAIEDFKIQSEDIKSTEKTIECFMKGREKLQKKIINIFDDKFLF